MCFYIVMHYNQSHTRVCWAYECNGQSEAFRSSLKCQSFLFGARPCWLNSALSRILSSKTTKCRCTYDVSKRFIHQTVHTAQSAFLIIRGVFESAYTRARLKSLRIFFEPVNVLCSLSLHNLFAVWITVQGTGNKKKIIHYLICDHDSWIPYISGWWQQHLPSSHSPS